MILLACLMLAICGNMTFSTSYSGPCAVFSMIGTNSFFIDREIFCG